MALKTHRQGNDFKLTLQVYRLNNAVSITNDTVPEGAVIEYLTDAQNIKLSLYCSTGACTILKKTVNVNVLVAEIPANIQAVGTYYVLLEYDKVDITLEDGLKRFTTDFDAFKIVDKSAYADTEGDMSLIGVVKVGLDGKSSYQYAQEHGYTGTEEEFGQLQYESTLAAINEAERIIAEQQREETFNNKMTSINEAISTTNTATINANTAATNANDNAILAKSSADNADQKAELANEAATNANIATTLANEAKINADNASLNANTAATNANDKATLADQKATLADSKATLANNAANTANTAATAATNAATSANNAATAANGQAGTYNVTVAVPLTAGNYYNSTTARSAVPSNVRLLGRVITYATSSGVWYTERFVGTDVLNWTTAANWEYVPRNSDLVQIGAELDGINGVMKLDYTLVPGWFQSNGSFISDPSTLYRSPSTKLPIKEGWYVYIYNSSNYLDQTCSLIFYDINGAVIKVYKYVLTGGYIVAPAESAMFAFTLKDSTGYVYLIPNSLMKDKDELTEYKNKLALLDKEKYINDVQYGKVGTDTIAYRDNAQIYSERPYKDFPINIKTISVKIGNLGSIDGGGSGACIMAGIQVGGNIKIVQEPRFFQYTLVANCLNIIPIDYLLNPNEILVVIISGGVLLKGGTGFTGNTYYFGGKNVSCLGQTFSGTATFVDNGIPSGNNGGFFSFTYDLYRPKLNISNVLTRKKIGFVGDSEVVSSYYNVTWAKEDVDKAPYSRMWTSSGHWSSMICNRVGAFSNNKGIAGTFVFGTTTSDGTDNSVIGQLQNIDKDIDYLIIFSGTNGTNLKDKNGIAVNTLGDANSIKLSGMPKTLDSTTETFTVCGALKWLIEYIYSIFPNVKLGFITPWANQVRNPNGTYTPTSSLIDGGNFAKAIRIICPLYSVPFFDNVKESNICWFNDNQRHALMGYYEIVPSISFISNFKIAKDMNFYVKDENAVYIVDSVDANNIPLTWHLTASNSSGKAYGDDIHISNSNGHRYLSYKYEEFIKRL